jgi:DnaJ-class molecular chaperone
MPSCHAAVHHLQVKRAFRTLRTRAHPDKGGDAEQFNALVKAHAVLSDPEKVCQCDACTLR